MFVKKTGCDAVCATVIKMDVSMVAMRFLSIKVVM